MTYNQNNLNGRNNTSNDPTIVYHVNRDELYNVARLKSIGPAKKVKKKFYKCSKEGLLILASISLILGIAIGSITALSLPKNPDIYQVASVQEMDYKQFAEMEARYILLSNGLNAEPVSKPSVFSGKAPLYDNDYSKISDSLNLENLYGFYLVFNRDGKSAVVQELTKLIKLLGYDSLDAFLINSPVIIDGEYKYGFYDYGEYDRRFPSIDVWAKYANTAYQQAFETRFSEDDMGRGLN